ncbi:MAG: hypothetical protein AB7E85_01795 [Pseudobdellovibrionaceae bacterium]
MTQNAPIVYLDAFRKTASPLMECNLAALTPEMEEEVYQGILHAFRDVIPETWEGVAFQLGMQAYQPDYPMHQIVFDVFGGDETGVPKLVTRDLDGTIRIARGYEALMQKIVNLLENGAIVIHHPFNKQFGMFSGADPLYSDSVQRYGIPHCVEFNVI